MTFEKPLAWSGPTAPAFAASTAAKTFQFLTPTTIAWRVADS